MMNQLSDAKNVSALPRHLIPQMRRILFTGLHNIMILSLGLMLLALGINLWAQKLERQKQASGHDLT
ncbi:transport protein [Agrilactobacillus composti DSM 18527 = JCM 14202]|nr:transport protein [Agrilactobacillus composti DSM 18527 = JCM 14202]